MFSSDYSSPLFLTSDFILSINEPNLNDINPSKCWINSINIPALGFSTSIDSGKAGNPKHEFNYGTPLAIEFVCAASDTQILGAVPGLSLFHYLASSRRTNQFTGFLSFQDIKGVSISISLRSSYNSAWIRLFDFYNCSFSFPSMLGSLSYENSNFVSFRTECTFRDYKCNADFENTIPTPTFASIDARDRVILTTFEAAMLAMNASNELRSV